MQFLLFIVVGAVVGATLKRHIPRIQLLPTVTLWLLLCTIFLMGMEIEWRVLQPMFLLRAVVLSIATIVGSVLCLSFLLFLHRHRHGKPPHRR